MNDAARRHGGGASTLLVTLLLCALAGAGCGPQARAPEAAPSPGWMAQVPRDITELHDARLDMSWSQQASHPVDAAVLLHWLSRSELRQPPPFTLDVVGMWGFRAGSNAGPVFILVAQDKDPFADGDQLTFTVTTTGNPHLRYEYRARKGDQDDIIAWMRANAGTGQPEGQSK